MKPFQLPSMSLAVLVATFMARRGVKRKSLSRAGGIVAWCVGFLSVGTGLRGFNLLLFYQVGSMATKYKKSIKRERDATVDEGSVRGPTQVLACSALAVVLSLTRVVLCGEEEPIDFDKSALASSLTCAVLAHHATCLGDTLASELGILVKRQPVMIVNPSRRVPPGTNGGVTWEGFLFSGVGGVIIALGHLLLDSISGTYPLAPWRTIIFGALCGVLGSVLDSVLGATVQATYWDPDSKKVYHHGMKLPKHALHLSGRPLLSNEQVNLVSVLLTSVIAGWFAGPRVFRR